MSKTALTRLAGQKVSAFDSRSFRDAMDLVKEKDILFATHIDSLTACEIPQRGKPKKGNREQRLVGFALAATRV
jgi:hypothetical protein